MFDSLSPRQRSIVFEKSGKFVVRACPGSGKTYTVAARLAHRMSNWNSPNMGIAVLSFTNVAWKEVGRKLNDNSGSVVSYPHYLGTIDSFINKYIFLPFGHLIMECNKRPILVGEPHGTWSGGNYGRDYDQYFDCTSLNINADIISTTTDMTKFHFGWKNNIDGSGNKHVKNIRNVKEKFWKLGYATQADANYFSLKILEQYPNISRSIAIRFPEMIIDEAQDTSEIQMSIIDQLIENGLENITLVGDPDQAIFEWNNARPNLFTDKFNEWIENSIILNENRRSSQKICNATAQLAYFDNPSTSITETVKDFEHIPEIIVYDPANIQATLDYFLELCGKHEVEVNHDNVAVIFRSKSIQNLIYKQPDFIKEPWLVGKKFVKDLAKGKYMAVNGDSREAFRLIERAVYKGQNYRNYCSQYELEQWISKKGLINHRKEIHRIIEMLPEPTGSIKSWVLRANTELIANGVTLQLRIDEDSSECTFDQIFKAVTDKDAIFRLGTVHTVKGETFESVLLILKEKGAKGRLYRTMLTQNYKTIDDEELRIAYVGMTRPRKLLVIAVPNELNKSAWENRLLLR
ncbi:ATP-dependent helicase [Paenibacillus agri]|uniref:DNA 3'-5' helicase n=1 Tax=Paenibacillus agri TaxID=2744309 RepID=A0A850ENC7_9BACL|nr:ATP-dependent helicase [Paenibacillus agri]NUU61259.1 ATP-dependent helicase [Paenibacillus agri]